MASPRHRPVPGPRFVPIRSSSAPRTRHRSALVWRPPAVPSATSATGSYVPWSLGARGVASSGPSDPHLRRAEGEPEGDLLRMLRLRFSRIKCLARKPCGFGTATRRALRNLLGLPPTWNGFGTPPSLCGSSLSRSLRSTHRHGKGYRAGVKDLTASAITVGSRGGADELPMGPGCYGE
jgi:hypothetical protein